MVPGNEEALSAAAQRLGLLSSLLTFPSSVTLCGKGTGKAAHFLKIPPVHLEKVLQLKSITIHSFSQQNSLEFFFQIETDLPSGGLRTSREAPNGVRTEGGIWRPKQGPGAPTPTDK